MVVVGKAYSLEMKDECDLMNTCIFFLCAIHPNGFSKFLALYFIVTPCPTQTCPASDVVLRRSISYKAIFKIHCYIKRKNYFHSYLLIPWARDWPVSILKSPFYFFIVLLASSSWKTHQTFMFSTCVGCHACWCYLFEETSHCGSWGDAFFLLAVL